MKTIFFLILFLFSFTAFSETQFENGTFESLQRDIKIEGSAAITSGTEFDYVQLSGFRIRGGVVLDVKVCGNIDHFENICLSLGNPRRRGDQRFRIPTRFTQYKHILIFDADLIKNLAVARF